MGKALCFSTSMHFMVSKSSAECTAVTKLRVRIEMADNFTCNVEFQFAQRPYWMRQKEERGGRRISPQDTAPECNIGARGWGKGEGVGS